MGSRQGGMRQPPCPPSPPRLSPHPSPFRPYNPPTWEALPRSRQWVVVQPRWLLCIHALRELCQLSVAKVLAQHRAAGVGGAAHQPAAAQAVAVQAVPRVVLHPSLAQQLDGQRRAQAGHRLVRGAAGGREEEGAGCVHHIGGTGQSRAGGEQACTCGTTNSLQSAGVWWWRHTSEKQTLHPLWATTVGEEVLGQEGRAAPLVCRQSTQPVPTHLARRRHTRRQECRNAVGGAATHHAAARQAAALCRLLGEGCHWGAGCNHLQREQPCKRLREAVWQSERADDRDSSMGVSAVPHCSNPAPLATPPAPTLAAQPCTQTSPAAPGWPATQGSTLPPGHSPA